MNSPFLVLIFPSRCSLSCAAQALRKACDIFNSEPKMEEQIATRYSVQCRLQLCRTFSLPVLCRMHRYGLKPADALQWYRAVRITASDSISAAAIDCTVSALRDSGVLPATTEVEPDRLIDHRFLKLQIGTTRSPSIGFMSSVYSMYVLL